MSALAINKVQGCLFVGLFFSSLSLGQVVDVSKDPRLQKPISIKLKIAQITKALPELSKLTGVKLDISPVLRDLKITVLVQDTNSGQVLSKIASVLGCEWKADGELLRLSMNSEESTIRDRYLDAEDKAAVKEISDELTYLTQLANIDPNTINQQLADQATALRSPKDATVRYDPKLVEMLKRARNRQDAKLGQFLAGLSADKVNAFWRGDVLAATPDQILQSAREPRVPVTGGPPPVPRNGLISPNVTNGVWPFFVEYDPFLYQVKVLQNGMRTIAMHPDQLIANPIPSGALAKTPFGKEVLGWDQPIPTEGDLTKVAIERSTVASGYKSLRYSVADFLENAFDQLQIPIICDGFRKPAAERDFNDGIGSFTAWLSRLKQQNHLMTRIENGIVMVRHGGFWRLRKFETPEDTIQSLEVKVSKDGPSVDDYATFVSKLTPEQAKPFSMKDGALAKFDTTPIEKGLPALKFYSALDRNTISRAMDDGISYAQMSGIQRQAFVDASLQGVFFGATPPAFNLGLARLASTGEGQGLGFIMRKENMLIQDSTGVLVTIPGQDMVFGANLSEAAIYKLPLAQ